MSNLNLECQRIARAVVCRPRTAEPSEPPCVYFRTESRFSDFPNRRMCLPCEECRVTTSDILVIFLAYKNRYLLHVCSARKIQSVLFYRSNIVPSILLTSHRNRSRQLKIIITPYQFSYGGLNYPNN